jgi:hypothetical protein
MDWMANWYWLGPMGFMKCRELGDVGAPLEPVKSMATYSGETEARHDSNLSYTQQQQQPHKPHQLRLQGRKANEVT